MKIPLFTRSFYIPKRRLKSTPEFRNHPSTVPGKEPVPIPKVLRLCPISSGLEFLGMFFFFGRGVRCKDVPIGVTNVGLNYGKSLLESPISRGYLWVSYNPQLSRMIFPGNFRQGGFQWLQEKEASRIRSKHFRYLKWRYSPI